jgi:hypothetical protein
MNMSSQRDDWVYAPYGPFNGRGRAAYATEVKVRVWSNRQWASAAFDLPPPQLFRAAGVYVRLRDFHAPAPAIRVEWVDWELNSPLRGKVQDFKRARQRLETRHFVPDVENIDVENMYVQADPLRPAELRMQDRNRVLKAKIAQRLGAIARSGVLAPGIHEFTRTGRAS